MGVAAYIDPSSMTYLIQIVAGVVIAAGAGLGFYWKRIQRKLRAKKQADESAAINADQTTDATAGETITAEMLRTDAQSDADSTKL